jgi:hypothetical protein
VLAGGVTTVVGGAVTTAGCCAGMTIVLSSSPQAVSRRSGSTKADTGTVRIVGSHPAMMIRQHRASRAGSTSRLWQLRRR